MASEVAKTALAPQRAHLPTSGLGMGVEVPAPEAAAGALRTDLGLADFAFVAFQPRIEGLGRLQVDRGPK